MPPLHRLHQFLAGFPTALARAVARFPAPLLFALAAAVAASLGNHASALHLSPATEGALQRVLLLWPLTLSIGVGCALGLGGSRPLRVATQLVITLAAVALWFLLPDPGHTSNAFWFRYWIAVGAVALASMGLLTKTNPPRAFWDGAWPLLSALFVAGIAAGIAILGVNLALFSIDKLFAVHFNAFYADVFFWGFFLLWPVGAFVRLPEGLPPAPVEVPAWLLGFARWVFLPLCAVYAAILYVYSGKILLAARWPDGWVAMPVLLLGALGMLAYQIARPARDRAAGAWAGAFCRVLPWVLGPLAVLLLLAFRVRIAEYGLTEWRGLGVFLGTWLILASAAIAVRPGLATRLLPLSLAAWLAVAAVGPFSLPALALPSQQKRLTALVARLGLLNGPRALPLDEKTVRQLRDDVRYLVETHGTEGLPPDIRQRWETFAEHQSPRTQRDAAAAVVSNEVLAALAVRDPGTSPAAITFRLEAAAISTQGFGSFYPISLSPYTEPKSGTYGPLRIELRDDELHVTAAGQPVLEAPLAALRQRLLARARRQEERFVTLPAGELALDFPLGGRSYRLLFTSLQLRQTYRDNERTDSVGDCSALLLVP